MQDEGLFERFHRIIDAMPVSQVEFADAAASLDDEDPVRRAVAFFIRCRQSRQALGKEFCTIVGNRIRRGMQEHVSAWLTAIEGLPAVHARLRRVLILNKPALEVIRQQDGPRTLFYLDPPYVPGTRAAREVYSFEMTDRDHRELLALLKTVQGKVMLSGYSCPLYDTALADWTRHTFDLPNNAAGGAQKDRETEVLWCNF
jgi:DNA adenine methylase